MPELVFNVDISDWETYQEVSVDEFYSQMSDDERNEMASILDHNGYVDDDDDDDDNDNHDQFRTSSPEYNPSDLMTVVDVINNYSPEQVQALPEEKLRMLREKLSVSEQPNSALITEIKAMVATNPDAANVAFYNELKLLINNL